MAIPMLQPFPRAGGPQCSYKSRMFFVSPTFSANWYATRRSSGCPVAWNPCFYLFSLSMAPLHVTWVSAAVWKWFCRCSNAIGPVYETSSDEEFFTPPTTPLPCDKEQRVAVISGSPTALISPTHTVQRLLSPSQMVQLRRRHAEAVRQLTTPPPVVTPSPHV